MNFGFDRSDTEPTSVDPLASKSGGKGSDKSKGKASSFLLEKRTRSTKAATDTRSKTFGKRVQLKFRSPLLSSLPQGHQKETWQSFRHLRRRPP
jgi:hypothetical protein